MERQEPIEIIWSPRVGEAIKRKNDPTAPKHFVTGVRGKGAVRTLSIDAQQARWWTTDMFEPWEPIVRPVEPVEEAAPTVIADVADTDDDLDEEAPIAAQPPEL